MQLPVRPRQIADSALVRGMSSTIRAIPRAGSEHDRVANLHEQLIRELEQHGPVVSFGYVAVESVRPEPSEARDQRQCQKEIENDWPILVEKAPHFPGHVHAPETHVAQPEADHDGQ